MDSSSFEIADPTDWLDTPLAAFADLESALHCQICKEFYDTPMITSCNHSFCSKCIRTCLSQEGRCPACRAQDQANKLRNNWALEEVVTRFNVARPGALKFARTVHEEQREVKRPGKRKRDVEPGDEEAGSSRTTRSKSRRTAESRPGPVEIIDDTEDEDLEGDDGVAEPNDGLVACPLGCGKRMKEDTVFDHLDRCEDEKKQRETRAKKERISLKPTTTKGHSRTNTRPQERLSELNYSLLKENALSKKLKELSIPNWGSKQLLVKRHTEWVNLWNANCDSNNPRSHRELLSDLDSWERSQGGRAPTADGFSSSVMRKDFDGAGWANKNKNEFSKLIANARKIKFMPTTADAENAERDPKLDHADVSKPSAKAYTATDAEVLTPGSDSGLHKLTPHSTTTDDVTDQEMADNDIADHWKPKPPENPIRPYADNPDAISSIREKVKAANEGREITPLMNQGFGSPIRSSATDTARKASQSSHTAGATTPLPGVESSPILGQSQFGLCRNGLSDSPTKKMPMFALPKNPVSDTEGALPSER